MEAGRRSGREISVDCARRSESSRLDGEPSLDGHSSTAGEGTGVLTTVLHVSITIPRGLRETPICYLQGRYLERLMVTQDHASH